jgi:hypothetical protein
MSSGQITVANGRNSGVMGINAERLAAHCTALALADFASA